MKNGVLHLQNFPKRMQTQQKDNKTKTVWKHINEQVFDTVHFSGKVFTHGNSF